MLNDLYKRVADLDLEAPQIENLACIALESVRMLYRTEGDFSRPLWHEASQTEKNYYRTKVVDALETEPDIMVHLGREDRLVHSIVHALDPRRPICV